MRTLQSTTLNEFRPYHVFLILFAAYTMITGCGESPSRSERIKNMIAQSKLASDPHSWSKPNEARVIHLHWVAEVDMNAHRIHATANYSVVSNENTREVIFDTRGLLIEEVLVNKLPVKWTIGEDRPIIGAPLTIPVKGDTAQVSIRYSTGPDAAALLWVDGDEPFLFTQSQAILARTWIPCQDSPGVRFTYTAEVTVPRGLLALMSADNPQGVNANGVYSFSMDQPVPSYLLALAVGKLQFRELGSRTGVYATADIIDRAAREFEDVEQMVTAAEKLYSPYAWGRYDLLVLPPAFPFGGMENPRLTFATPTILAGDKSLVSLVAHELAHSWSGNLVTNATWNDFWLNEGFTVYFELRIMEEVYGRERSEMLAALSMQDLLQTLGEVSSADSHLKLSLEGRDPDDGMTDIAYNKGYFLLRAIEEHCGRERFDAFLKNYFSNHAFQVMDTEQFIAYLKTHLLSEEEYQVLNVDGWIYGPGLPANHPRVASPAMEKVDAVAAEWTKLRDNARIPWKNWSYQEQYRFLSEIRDFRNADLAILDKSFGLTACTNSEVLFKWLELSVKHNYTPAYDRLESFLSEVGRRKFVLPLYQALVDSGQTDRAKSIYAKARGNYHAITVQSVDALLAEKGN